MTPSPYVHEHPFRVVMSEVDMAQIHFTAMYRWMDRGLTEWLAAVGHPFTRILDEGPGIPIVDSRCRFRLRVMLDDELVLRSYVTGVGRTSFRSRHEFRRAGAMAVEGELVHVCVDRVSRATVPVPDWLRAHEVPAPPLASEA